MTLFYVCCINSSNLYYLQEIHEQCRVCKKSTIGIQNYIYVICMCMYFVVNTIQQFLGRICIQRTAYPPNDE